MKLSVIGSGHWGSILIPKFDALLSEGVYLVYGHQNIDYFHEEGIKFTEDIPALMKESDAVVIASPAELHFNLAYMALEHNCHVWVEKPLCLNSSDAYKLTRLANEKGKLLFVDHQLCYSRSVDYLVRFNAPVNEIVEATGIFKKKFSSEKKLNSAWNMGIHLVAIAVYQRIPLSKFTLHTSYTSEENVRSFSVWLQNDMTIEWDILNHKEDMVQNACKAFLRGMTMKHPWARTGGDHGLEVIRAMEWLLADYSQTVETPGEPMVLPIF